jgi:hypothetical protein
MQKIYSDKEIAEVLLQIVDAQEDHNPITTGIEAVECIGQGIYEIYVDRDTLTRESGQWGYPGY